MSQETIRDTLNSLVVVDFPLAYPDVTIVYDNQAFDRNSPPDTWVEYEISFSGAEQIGMAFKPSTRVHGFLYVTVWTKEGAGSKRSTRIADWFAAKLAYVTSNGVQIQAAEPVPDKPPAGWFTNMQKLYFYANTP
jgi:hypothetical protein